jgi:CO/xanthine dehydrogenase FAD-binding subunit
MIIEYHRPESIPEALELLARTEGTTVPLGGGTTLSQRSTDSVAVVDLQSLGLNSIDIKGNHIQIGARVTLQQILNFDVESAIKSAIRHEATYNHRQVRTIAGSLVTADGRSPLATMMLALDAELNILPKDEKINFGNYLHLRDQYKPGYLINQITIANNIDLAYEYVARTPADLPIVCVAVACWPSGRTRVALGGYGSAPKLAMDGPEPVGAEAAAKDAYQEAGDQWGRADYRSDVAGVLTLRCIQKISNKIL